MSGPASITVTNLLLMLCACSGAVAGILWTAGWRATAALPLGAALGAIGFVLVSQTPQSGISEGPFDVALQLCAILFWAFFAGAMTRLTKHYFSKRSEHIKHLNQRLTSASKGQRSIESDLERLKGLQRHVILVEPGYPWPQQGPPG